MKRRKYFYKVKVVELFGGSTLYAMAVSKEAARRQFREAASGICSRDIHRINKREYLMAGKLISD